jgi:hypothetical protein
MENNKEHWPRYGTCTVVGENPCARDPLEVKGKGIGGVADKEAHTVHSFSIISQQQYFVARCLISYIGTVMPLVYIVHVFSFYPQASDVRTDSSRLQY